MGDQCTSILWVFVLGLGDEGDEAWQKVAGYTLIRCCFRRCEEDGADAAGRYFGRLLEYLVYVAWAMGEE
jgi:hypothetical protein